MNTTSILVVDDATETLEVIAACLSSQGYEVTSACGGKEAIGILERRNFDLLITDLLMPDVDGMEVIMAARRAQPDVQIVAMTGGGEFFSAKELLKLGAGLGADAHLAKPFSRAQLLEAINEVTADAAEFERVAPACVEA